MIETKNYIAFTSKLISELKQLNLNVNSAKQSRFLSKFIKKLIGYFNRV